MTIFNYQPNSDSWDRDQLFYDDLGDWGLSWSEDRFYSICVGASDQVKPYWSLAWIIGQTSSFEY